MERRKAIAVAAAITMSLTSGVLAAGANFGAFGFGGAAVAARQNTVAVPAPTSATPRAVVNTSLPERERDNSARLTEPIANRPALTRGEQNG